MKWFPLRGEMEVFKNRLGIWQIKGAGGVDEGVWVCSCSFNLELAWLSSLEAHKEKQRATGGKEELSYRPAEKPWAPASLASMFCICKVGASALVPIQQYLPRCSKDAVTQIHAKCSAGGGCTKDPLAIRGLG